MRLVGLSIDPAQFIKKSVRIELVEMWTDSYASTSSARTVITFNSCRINSKVVFLLRRHHIFSRSTTRPILK